MADFICPVSNAKITSPYGYRTHPITKVKTMHKGVDLISTKGRNVPIYAMADGTVSKAQTLGTYGKVVMIKHSINNKSYETVYAHLDSYNVKVGDKVKQGAVIGIMGTTGGSTGIHLHNEVNFPSWQSGQPYTKNPLDYYKLTDVPNKSTSPTPSKNETITAYLEELEADSSFEFRKELALIYKVSNYTGTVNQNSTLLSKVKSDKSTAFRFYSGEVKDEATAIKVKTKINNKYPSWTLHVVQLPNKKWQLKSGTFKGFEDIIDASNKVKKLGYSANIKAD